MPARSRGTAVYRNPRSGATAPAGVRTFYPDASGARPGIAPAVPGAPGEARAREGGAALHGVEGITISHCRVICYEFGSGPERGPRSPLASLSNSLLLLDFRPPLPARRDLGYTIRFPGRVLFPAPGRPAERQRIGKGSHGIDDRSRRMPSHGSFDPAPGAGRRRKGRKAVTTTIAPPVRRPRRMPWSSRGWWSTAFPMRASR